MPNPGPASTITPTSLYGGNAPEGFAIGSDSQSKITAYGVSPGAVQRVGSNQEAISSNAVAGVVINATVAAVVPSSGTITGGSVSAIAVVFTSQALISTLGVDFLVVNKPTAQANIGIVGQVISTVSTVLIQYINPSTTNATATAGEAYLYANLRSLASTVTLTPPVIGVSSIVETLYTVTGVAVGDLLAVQKPTFQSYIGVVGMRVAANNQIGISMINLSSAPVTPTATEVWTYVSLSGIQQASNVLVANINMASAPVTVTGGAINTVTVTVTGLAVSTDWPMGTQLQRTATTYAPIAARVSAVNVLEVTYIASSVAGTSVVTPTAADIITVPFMRQNANPALIVQTVTLTPTAIGALTCTEVQFAVSNITVSTVTWVNKPSFTTGLGVVGCRTVSTNVIGITYINNTAVTATPPAEIYTVGNFPNMLGVGHQLVQQAPTATIQGLILTSEMRAALVGIGFIAGA